MKRLLKFISVFLIVFTITFVLFKSIIKVTDIPYELEVTYSSNSDDVFQMFYTNGTTIKEFNEKDSIKKNIVGDNNLNSIKFDIPEGVIDKIRIDVGTKIGGITIAEIKLSKLFSSYTWSADDIKNNFKSINDISNINVKNNNLYITVSGGDPFIINDNVEKINNLINNQDQNIIMLFNLFIATAISLILTILITKIARNKINIVRRIRIYLNNFYKYKNLLRELVIRDIKIKYKRSILGFLWSLLNPLLMMMVIYIVFSNLFRFDIQNFPMYLLTGQIFFNFFSESTNLAMGSIMSNSSLIRKVYIPKYIFPISKVLSSFINLLFALIAIVIMIIITKVKITWIMLLFPLSLLYLLMFTMGVGLILAAYAVFFRDLIYLYGILLMAWMYLTPVFYPVSIIPSRYKLFIRLNPMYYFIEHFREIILYAKIPSLSLNLTCLIISAVTLFIGLFVFYKNQDKFILFI